MYAALVPPTKNSVILLVLPPPPLSLSHAHTVHSVSHSSRQTVKMADRQGEETLNSGNPQSPDEEAELEKLEADVNQMAQKIVDFRQTLPAQLHNTLSTILSAQRPLPISPSSEPVSARTSLESGGTSSAGDDQENAEKVVVIKQKITSNAAAIPLLLKRLRDCMSRIDKLNSCNEPIHPVFKRKRIN